MRRILLMALVTLGLGTGLPLHPAHAEEAAATDSKKQQYTCPMHHQVRSDHPGECPICHMTLVPVKAKAQKAEDKKPSGERKILYYRNPMEPSIHSKGPAKDDMGMDYIPVYESDAPKGKPQSAADTQGAERAAVSLTPEQFKLSGVKTVAVAQRDLTQELRVPGRALGSERVSFQVFEQDLGQIRAGMGFEAEAPSLPGELLVGKITSVDSILDPMTRTARVNGVLIGRGGAGLRTEASLAGTLKIKLANRVVVPEDAVVHTGAKDVVYVSDGADGFAPRVVALGSWAQGFYEIKSGVSTGEQISAGPNFLLDSESRIQLPPTDL